ncbi:hypothetical protein Anas_05417 [Armadillidium nasatum]|uniref:C-type lectin domain-containing protein n=1 Tax=Armadillidium nasatum TaxID=96803 RepID=A0A5N5TN61_9CRUS|nr:hypothetical protein Anas_05417 [Armadillidium nasatum]
MFVKFFQMLKIIIVLIVAGVFCSNLANAKGISKEKCEEKGGKYCPGPKVKECYLFLKEEVSSFQDAFDLCVKNGAELPYYTITDYTNLLNCSKIPWEFPYTMFFKNPLPTGDKCLTATRISLMEITTQNHCSIKGKAKVGCEIPL